jgi:N6-adenosine-specific RNA methylase IME4
MLVESDLLMPPHPFAGLRRHGYACIAADPALAFTTYTSIQSTNPQSTRDLRRHYRCMSVNEICALPVADLAAKSGCHLFQLELAAEIVMAAERAKGGAP